MAAEATREQGGPQVLPEVLAYWRTHGQVWTRDRKWASDAEKLDARYCLAGEPRPFVEGECGGDPICNWAAILVNLPCSLETFGEVMFQGDRYVHAQIELGKLLRSKPREVTVSNAADAAAWCAEVMRYVSLARWATNMHSRYLRPLNDGPAAKVAVSQIMSALPKRPEKAHPDDIGLVDHQHLLAMWAPKDFTPQAPRRVLIPTEKSDFNPAWLARHTKLVVAGQGDTSVVTQAPWPRELFRDARWPNWSKVGRVPPGSKSMKAMEIWFQRTAGQGLWLDGWEVLGSVLTRHGCELGPRPYCARPVPNLRFYWGTGEALLKMSAAWAQDVVDTTWGQATSDAFDVFLKQVEALPPELRGISLNFVREFRDTINAQTMDQINAMVAQYLAAVSTVVGVAVAATSQTGPGAIIGLVIAVLGALIGILLKILAEAGALAIGGGELERGCLPSPVIRMIDDVSTKACQFDPRGEGQLDRLANQAAAFSRFAADNAPLDVIFAATGIGAGDEPPPNESAGPGFPEGGEDPAAEEDSVSPLLVGGLVLGLGALAYFATKDR